ncbi:aminotransferase class IV [Schlesneria paludicola]|uniref:aminotransferase class IV n=1 Tax=Schlesneria paludicola TaxID=360056 RepID=UPI00029A74CE|nr:aminotransferase class IV [Schlesneria paludicola]
MSTTSSERHVYLTGKLVPESEAKISIFDSAVMLGDCLTESTRTFRHLPFRLDEHITRLYKSLKVCRVNPGLTVAEMTRATLETLEANRGLMGPDDDCWIVHNISRGLMKPGPSPSQSNPATIMIFTSPMDLRGWARYYTEGCHAVTSISRAIPAQSLDARVKNRSRLFYTLADTEARMIDPDGQVVILDQDGYVSENKGGNIFAVIDGVVQTPTTENCLAGISRQTVLELAVQLGIPVRESRLQPYDFYTADEVFFTSTPYCIMPATRFNGLTVGDGKVGAITRWLLAAWSERVGVDIVAQGQRQLSQ